VLAAIFETGPTIGLVFIMIVAVAVPIVAVVDALLWPAWALHQLAQGRS
jgi:hypothetical protein